MPLQVYVEDQSDRGGGAVYDRAVIGLKKFAFDLGSQASLERCVDTLKILKGSDVELVLHPDISTLDAASLLGPIDTISATGPHLAKVLTDGGCGDLVDNLTTILVEPENSAYLSIIGPTAPYFHDRTVLLATWKRSFPKLKTIAFFGTNLADIKNSDNVYYEAYNSYSLGDKGADACFRCDTDTTPQDSKNAGCLLDFNGQPPKPPAKRACKTGVKLSFPGAVCGPNDTLCTAKACGGKPCQTHVHCDASWAYGGNIYDPTAPIAKPWTLAERGTYLAKIQTDFLGVGHDAEVKGRSPVFMFPFTDASCPTLRAVIKNEADFETFLAAFKQQFVTAGTFNQYTLDNVILYGAWGTPDWIATPRACTGDAQCTDDWAAQCTANTCQTCTTDAACARHNTNTRCSQGACVPDAPPPPKACTPDSDCTDDANPQCISGTCRPCTGFPTLSPACATHGAKTQCTDGSCVKPDAPPPPKACTLDSDCTDDSLPQCTGGTCQECTGVVPLNPACASATHGKKTACDRGACVKPGYDDGLTTGQIVGIAVAAACYAGLMAAAIWGTLRARRYLRGTRLAVRWRAAEGTMVVGSFIPILLPVPIVIGTYAKKWTRQ
jgi:hypothetical protein